MFSMSFGPSIFSTKAGELVGPIETRDGYYIAKIQEIGRLPPEDFEKNAALLSTLIRREQEYDLLLKLRRDVEIIVY